jgi:hypothetical protein
LKTIYSRNEEGSDLRRQFPKQREGEINRKKMMVLMGGAGVSAGKREI